MHMLVLSALPFQQTSHAKKERIVLLVFSSDGCPEETVVSGRMSGGDLCLVRGYPEETCA